MGPPQASKAPLTRPLLHGVISGRPRHHRPFSLPAMAAALGDSKAHQGPSIPRAESCRERPGDRKWGDIVLEPRTRQSATGATSPFLGRDRLCAPYMGPGPCVLPLLCLVAPNNHRLGCLIAAWRSTNRVVAAIGHNRRFFYDNRPK